MYNEIKSNLINTNNINKSILINSSSLHICSTYIDNNKSSETIDIKGIQEEINESTFCTFPTFIKSHEFIYIPNKVERLFDYFISQQDLKEIDSNITTSKELIYLFLSKLIYSNEYRNLSIDYISNFLFGESNRHSNRKVRLIINLLKEGTKDKGGIIEIDEAYIEKVKARGYKLSSTYLNKGYKKYYFKTDKVKNLYKKYYYKKLAESVKNSIVINLFNLYSNIILPTIEEINIEGKKLIKDGYITKKGKILKFRNKKSKELDNSKYSYVEDAIETFKYLTEDGYILPNVGNENSGGRVVDSFSLMPSWIRNLVKINDEKVKECDYSALHPNIAIMLYNGTTEFISHQFVADELQIEKDIVKTSHLSFFNQEVWQMKTNPVYPFYQMKEPKMLESIIKDKYTNGYKNITKQLFQTEVKIMTEVIENLNKKGVYVGYIYDALFCSESDYNQVKKEMNRIVLKYKVKTFAK